MSWNIDMPTTRYYSGDSGHDAIQGLVNEVMASKKVAIDTETTGLSKWADIPLYWSLAWGNNRATLRADVLQYFQEPFNCPDITWLLANAKFDMHMLANFGFSVAGNWWDIQVMHALLYEDKPHRLKFIANHILSWTYADFQDQFGKIGKKQSAEELIFRAERENFDLLVEYAANDAWATLQAGNELQAQLEREFTFSLFNKAAPYIDTLWDFFSKVEAPYTKVLWAMERRGIKIDRQKFAAARPEAQAKVREIERAIVKAAGFMLNPKSTPQLRKYFFEIAGLQPLSMSDGGKTGVRQPQVNEAFIEYYQNENEVAHLLIEHREYSKLLSTYIEGLDALVDPWDRIHTNFNQDVARTGRLSSSEPNLQNIPRPENDHWNLRGAFITEPGWKIIASDYSQLEMRLLAAAALEQDMIDIFLRGWDVHTGNAALMYDAPYEDIALGKKMAKDAPSMDQAELYAAAEEKAPGISGRCKGDLVQYLKDCASHRSDAKNIGFGLNYGMGANKLARDLGVDKKIAEAKIDQYKKTYPAVDRFMKEAIEEGRKYGYSFTVMGRRRNIPMITSNRKDQQALGERLAVNTQIQGSAADVCRMAQLNLYAAGLHQLYDCHMILQVHDELVFECPSEMVDVVKPEIEELMAHPFSLELPCPMVAEAGVGDSWGEAK